jgi:hypothetical protein
MEAVEIMQLIQGGGTPALVICAYFIWKLETRLARIEKAFEIAAQHLTVIVKDVKETK